LLALLVRTKWVLPATPESHLATGATDLNWAPESNLVTWRKSPKYVDLMNTPEAGEPDTLKFPWQIAKVEYGAPITPVFEVPGIPLNRQLLFSKDSKLLLEAEEAEEVYERTKPPAPLRVFTTRNGGVVRERGIPSTPVLGKGVVKAGRVTIPPLEATDTAVTLVDTKPIQRVWVSADHRFAATEATYEKDEFTWGRLIVWSVPEARQIYVDEGTFHVEAVQFSPGGSFFAYRAQYNGYDGPGYWQMYRLVPGQQMKGEVEFLRGALMMQELVFDASGRYAAMVFDESNLVVDEINDPPIHPPKIRQSMGMIPIPVSWGSPCYQQRLISDPLLQVVSRT
jgi:hypothetical protein